jgi:hypothetical protein
MVVLQHWNEVNIRKVAKGTITLYETQENHNALSHSVALTSIGKTKFKLLIP